MKSCIGIDKAKEIFYANFGSTYFMKRNGEHETFLNYKVPIDVIKEWIQDIKQNIVLNLANNDNEYDVAVHLFHLVYLDIELSDKRDVLLNLLETSNRTLIMNVLIQDIKLYPNEFLNILIQLQDI